MQNRDDVDGSQRPQTKDAPELKTPAPTPAPIPANDLGGHMGPAGDPVEGDEAAVEQELAQNSPAKE